MKFALFDTTTSIHIKRRKIDLSAHNWSCSQQQQQCHSQHNVRVRKCPALAL